MQYTNNLSLCKHTGCKSNQQLDFGIVGKLNPLDGRTFLEKFNELYLNKRENEW